MGDKSPGREFGDARDWSDCDPSGADATPVEPQSVPIPEKTEPSESEQAVPEQRRYSWLRNHAQGGLGKVSIAWDECLQREVAYKQIRPDRLSADALRRFLNEAEITGQLEHPGIVPIYALEEDAAGQPCYVMRFIQGRTLTAAIEEYHEQPSSQGLRDLLHRFMAICQTVAYAHNKGIVHRDLKPENILLGGYGETLVVDWGLAKRLKQTSSTPPAPTPQTEAPTTHENSAKLQQPSADAAPAEPVTQAGLIMGTPAFMAPEQARGTELLSFNTDIYGLGAILYSILTGKAPYEGKSEEILHQLQTGVAPPHPQNVKASVPSGLATISLKATSRSPEDRYSSAKELAVNVERWLNHEPIPDHQERWTERWSRWRQKYPKFDMALFVGPFVVALLLLAMVLVQEVFKNRIEQALAEAEANRTKAEQSEQRTSQALVEAEKSRRTAEQSQKLTFDTLERLQQTQAELVFVDQQQGPRRKINEDLVNYYQQLIRLRQGDPTAADQLGLAHVRLGQAYHREGRRNEARAEYTAALGLFASSDPRERSPQYGWVIAHMGLGGLAWAEGDREAAKRAYDQASLLCERFREAAHVELRAAEAELAYRSAFFFPLRSAEMKSRLARSLNLYDDLLRNPSSSESIHEGFVVRRGRAYTLQELAFVKETASERRLMMDQARAEWEALVKEFPHVTEFQEGLALCLSKSAHVALDVGNHAQAIADLEKAAQIQEELARLDAKNKERRAVLAQYWFNIGRIQLAQKKVPVALPPLERAVALLDQLCVGKEVLISYRAEAAKAHHILALARELQGKRIEAVDHFRTAVTRWMQLRESVPLSPDDQRHFQSYLRDGVIHLARLEFAQGQEKSSEVTALVRKASGYFLTNPKTLLDFCRVLCVAVPSQGSGIGMDSVRLELALDLLNKAVQAGYKDRADLEKDRRLDPIKHDPRFARILNSMR